MKSTKKLASALVVLSLSIFAVTVVMLKPYSGWTHLELGAGNYGLEGHTQFSLQKTLSSLEISDKPNFIERLPERNDKPFNPDHQFKVLYWTLDELVERHGDKGVFHVNDLYPEYAEVAANSLKNYAQKKGYHKIVIDVVPGDFSLIDPETTLKPFKLKRYDSVHLKNPEISLYGYGLDGDITLFNERSRQQARRLLQKLANLSHNGLTFFPITNIKYFPSEEKIEYIEKELFYHTTKDWAPVAYHYPDGKISQARGTVFFIRQNRS